MDYVIALCAFLGGWLLVAGPSYQAGVELREQEFDQEQIEAAVSSVVAPRPISPWWWLLPPVGFLLQRRQSKAHQRAVMDALGPEQLAQTITFANKANGWLLVACGAFLIAVKETWHLIELLHWPVFVFWLLVVLLPVLCVGTAVQRLQQTSRLLQEKKDAAAARAAEPDPDPDPSE